MNTDRGSDDDDDDSIVILDTDIVSNPVCKMHSKKRKRYLEVEKEKSVTAKKVRNSNNNNSIIDLTSDSENETDVSECAEMCIIKKNASSSTNLTKSIKRNEECKAKENETNAINILSNVGNQSKSKNITKKKISLIEFISESENDLDTSKLSSFTRENKKLSVSQTSGIPLDSRLFQKSPNQITDKVKLDSLSKQPNCGKITKELRKSIVRNEISKPEVNRVEANPKDIQNAEKIVISNKDLRQYIGDISDLDFDDMEMDVTTSPQISTMENTQKTICKSQMEKTNDLKPKHDQKTIPPIRKQIENASQFWKKDFDFKSNESPSLTTIHNKSFSLPMTINASGNKIFRFFWVDAFEDSYRYPGTIYLFGKVLMETTKEFVSCCVAVKNIPRRIYLLPREYIITSNGEREPNTFSSVHAELKAYMNKNNISEFRCKEVKKTYVFERKHVPQTSLYLEVRYSATYPAFDSNYTGRTIADVFGTSVGALDLFLIEKNIKGPCWLDVKIPFNHETKFPVNNAFSWCKIEVSCEKMEDISVTRYQQKIPEIPPIVIAALNVQTCLDSKLQQNEIVNVGILIHRKFPLNKTPTKPLFDEQYCIVSRTRNTNWPVKLMDKLPKIKQTKIIYCETELDLLEKLLEIIHCSDPDVVISYDSEFQFEIVLSKIFTMRLQKWSRIGKLKIFKPPKFKGKIYFNQVFCGRPVCDIQKSIKEINLKINNYDLHSISTFVLDRTVDECKEIKPDDCPEYYVSMDKLESLIHSTMRQTLCILEISAKLNLLPLALQITNIAGNTLSRTLSSGVAERNEFLLLHAFHASNYLTPDKKKEKDEINFHQKKSAYSGGTVLEPRKGFYGTLVLVMDFNSLYPSIIQEFNICFTTIRGAACANADDLCISDAISDPGILPREIRKLVESRMQLKKMLQSENLSSDLRQQYNVRQQALKLMANSMYGCLGATHSRFYSKGLAGLVTMKGREVFQKAKEIVQGFNYEVIYGDTDSIMINTKILDYDEVINISRDVKRKVNKLYRKIELEIAQVYKYMLLIKKKQYAAMKMTKLPNGEMQYTKEVKGLEIIRRDWCSLACNTGNQILDQILSDQPSETRLKNILQVFDTLSKNLRENNVPLSSLEITKQLIRDIQTYSTDKHLSHVVVARRLNKICARKWKAGDAISYIICEDGTRRPALERAYHISELKANSRLKIDLKYYLLNQIHPILFKICEPIQGIDDVLIAQHLGVEDVYKPKGVIQNQENKMSLLPMRENRYANCIPFKFKCHSPNCKAENEIKSLITKFPMGAQLSLEICSNPECNTPPWKYAYSIQNKLQLDIREFISKYYLGEVECDNPLCFKTVKRISLDTVSRFVTCSNCFDGYVHRIYKESDLYNQLCFFLHIFTLNESDYKELDPPPSTELIAVYDSIKEFIMDQVESNAYFIVDLTKLFSFNKHESNSVFQIKFDDTHKK